MIVSCIRCSAPAGVAMNFNYTERHLWVDDLDAIDTGYPLCENHAARLTSPVGWAVTDRRAAERPLFVAREVA